MKTNILITIAIILFNSLVFAQNPPFSVIEEWSTQQSPDFEVDEVVQFLNSTSSTDVITFGATNQFSPEPYRLAATLLDATHFVIVFDDNDNNDYGTAIIAEISGNTITYGTEVVFKSNDITNFAVDRIDDTHFVLAYSTGTSSWDDNEAIIGTVTGTSITFGAVNNFGSAYGPTYLNVVATDATHIVVAFRDNNNSNYATAIAGIVSGDDITFGSGEVFNSVRLQSLSMDVLDASRVVVTYDNMTDTDYPGVSTIGTISGNSISFGSDIIFKVGVYESSVCALSPNHIVVTYMDRTNSYFGFSKVGTVNGTNITYGDASVFQSDMYGYLTGSRLDENNFVLTYQDNANNYLGTAVMGTVTGTSIAFNTSSVYSTNKGEHNSVMAIDDSHFAVAYVDVEPGAEWWDPETKTGQSVIGTIGRLILTWDGSTDSDWNTADNWDADIVPSSSENVIIANAGNAPIIATGIGASCNNLTVNASTSLTVNAGGSLITEGSITNNGTVNIKQTITDGTWHLISAPNSNTTANTFLDDYLQYWTENGQTWTDNVETNTVLTPVMGYSLWGTAKGSYMFTGTPNTGEQSISLSYHEDAGKGADGMNLVGNPYPSSIDWETLQPTYGAAYLWDPSAGDYIEKTNGDIAPMQGFFIYTSNNGSSFTLQNNNRSHGGSFYKNGENKHSLLLLASNGTYTDELIIDFDTQASENFELTKDAWKMISGGQGVSQLWTESPDGKLAIDTRPYTESIQLGFANNEAGTYSIAIKEIADISTAILEDTKLNIFHDLSDGAYSFDWSLNDDETRFKLHCNTTAVEDISLPEIQAYVAGDNIIIKSKSTSERIILLDITGRTLGVWESTESIPAPKTAGVYLVTIETDNDRITKKIIVE